MAGAIEGISSEDRISAKEGLPGWVLKHREALVLDRNEHEAQFAQPIPVGNEWNSVLCVPLINDLDPVGILWVWRLENQRAFNLEDALIVKRFGEQVAKDMARSAGYMELDRRADHLEGANKRLSELHNMKRVFFSTVKNDIRTPLAGISYHAGLLSGPPSQITDEARNKHLWSLSEEIVHLADFVNEITDLLALESKLESLDRESIQLNELIQDCVLSCTPTAAQKGVVILTELEPDLPMITVDKKLLHQAIHYLMTHAVRDSVKDGTIRIATELKTPEKGEPTISLILADEEIDETQRAEGLPTNLGCYLVNDLIEQVGGTVSVNDPHSRLTMHFPAREAPAGDPRRESPYNSRRAA
jgi:K+-sensing histidine kinase KdpD